MFGRRLIVPMLALAMLSAAMISTVPAAAQHASIQADEVHPAKRLVSVDFPGGTTAQYYDALQEALGQNVVVIMPGAEDVMMPPVKLTDVPFGEAVQVAKYVQGEQRLRVEDEGQTWIVVHAWIIGGPDVTVRTQTWPLAEIIQQGTSADALLSAVQAGLDLHDAKARVKYHDETKVLFARGTLVEIELINDTLQAAGESASTGERLGLTDLIGQDRKDIADLLNRVFVLEEQVKAFEAAQDAAR